MSGGGKGGSQTTSTQIPAWLEEPSKRAIARGEAIGQMDYMPYMGPDVAAFSPTQEAAFQNTNAAAGAFGLGHGVGTGMPAAQDFGGGVRGYSSYPAHQQTVDAFAAAFPELAAQRNAFFGAQRAPAGGGLLSGSSGSSRSGGSSGGSGRSNINRAASPTGGGYTSVRDMFDGGGAGKSGNSFSGGPVSGTLNKAGVKPLGSRS